MAYSHRLVCKCLAALQRTHLATRLASSHALRGRKQLRLAICLTAIRYSERIFWRSMLSDSKRPSLVNDFLIKITPRYFNNGIRREFSDLGAVFTNIGSG